jgi:hypothetical protein
MGFSFSRPVFSVRYLKNELIDDSFLALELAERPYSGALLLCCLILSLERKDRKSYISDFVIGRQNEKVDNVYRMSSKSDSVSDESARILFIGKNSADQIVFVYSLLGMPLDDLVISKKIPDKF